MTHLISALLIASLFSLPVQAAEYLSGHQGQEERPIKSLSKDDIESITQGKGWGMAKPAELNGYPGPRHVLDMADEIDLSSTQRDSMQQLFDQMKKAAISAGGQFLEAEQKIEQAFRQKTANPGALSELIQASAKARASLRYVHLSTHLEAIELLSRHQVVSYNRLRGYGDHSQGHHPK